MTAAAAVQHDTLTHTRIRTAVAVRGGTTSGDIARVRLGARGGRDRLNASANGSVNDDAVAVAVESGIDRLTDRTTRITTTRIITPLLATPPLSTPIATVVRMSNSSAKTREHCDRPQLSSPFPPQTARSNLKK